MTEKEKKPRKTPAHVFKPGNNFSKGRGRPVGSTGKSKDYMAAVGKERMQEIVDNLVKAAQEGDSFSIKLLIERTNHFGKGRRIRLSRLDLSTLEGIQKAHDDVCTRMANEEISPAEAIEIQETFDFRRKLIETKELHVMVDELKIRLEAIEGKK